MDRRAIWVYNETGNTDWIWEAFALRHLRCLLILLLACVLPASCALAESAYPLTADMTAYGGAVGQTVASVQAPEGYALQESAPSGGADPEYYFVPVDPDRPVRFLYYTAGSGDPDTLASAALDSYAMFYDEFDYHAPVAETLAGLDTLRFDYTCAYPDRDGSAMVYEQTCVCYVTIREDRFVACICSLAFDDPAAYLDADALLALTEQALGAIRIE